MYRVLFSIVAVMIGLWVLFAVFSALKGLTHLALVLAVLFVVYSLVSNLRPRHNLD